MNINKKNIFLDKLEKALKFSGFDTNESDFMSIKQTEISQSIQDSQTVQLNDVGIKDVDTSAFRETNYDAVFGYVVLYVFNLAESINKETGFQLTADQIEDFLANIEENNILDKQLDDVLGVEF